MKKEMRKCAVCGKKFTPKSANAVYCSDKCYKAAKAARDKARKHTKKVAEKPAKKVVKGKCVAKFNLAAKKPVKIVDVHHGDGIRFVDFTPEQIIETAKNIAQHALLKAIDKLEATKVAVKKPAKKATKKVAKK